MLFISKMYEGGGRAYILSLIPSLISPKGGIID